MKQLLLLLGLLSFALDPARAAAPPNIIFILTDDLGATDLGCSGSAFYQTPQIDKLARDGVRFERAYAACTVCSPTRAAFVTGRYPAQLHLTDWIAGHHRPAAKLRIPDWTKSLPHDVPTLPQALHAAGYVSAAIGKWHVADQGPEKFGFDVAMANNSKGQPATYFSPYKNPQLAEGPEGEFLSDRLTTEAEKFIAQNKDRPFFLYLPHFAVHTPLAGKPEVVEKYQARAAPENSQHNPVYAALVESVDDSVGRVRAKVEQLGLTDRTIIVFTSDNGGLVLNQVTFNLGMRAGKGSAYEGGVRVPAIVYMPGLTKAGMVSDTPVITMDWTATFLELAGVKPLPEQAGVSLLPVLRGEPIAERPLFWHYPHYHPGGATPYGAMLEGGWRLVEFFEGNRVELYNLKDDPLEARDLAAAQPQKAAEMRARLNSWREKQGAQLPTVNPDYDAVKDAQQGKRRKVAR